MKGNGERYFWAAAIVLTLAVLFCLLLLTTQLAHCGDLSVGLPDATGTGFDPVRWAEAAKMLSATPGFWAFWTLIVILILAKWPPWRDRKSKGGE